LIGYGGHFAAAGMTIELDKIEAFRNKFEEVVSATILPELLLPEIVIDSEIKFKDITWPFYNIISQMEPFGPENLRPHFLVKNVLDTGYSKILKEEHLRFVLRQDNITLNGIGFGMAEKLPLLQLKKPVDIVFKIDENEWNGQKTLQLRILDLRPSDSSLYSA
jgi:single-stranded-DNA-specific exonuclease